MQNKTKINLYQVRDFSENFNVLLAFLKQNYGQLLKGIIFLLPITLIAAYFLTNYQKSVIGLNTLAVTGYNDLLSLYGAIYGNPNLWIGQLIHYSAVFLSACYTVSYMVSYTETEDVEIDSSFVWKRVKRIFFPVLLCSILYSLIVSFGFILCFIPGIILAIYFLFYQFVYIAEEGTSIKDTFSRSWDLIRDNWWITFGTTLLVGILVSILGAVFSFPAILSGLSTGLGMEFFASDVYLYISLFISYAGAFLLMPITFVTIGILYFSRRSDHDDIAINHEIDQIGTPNNNRYY